MRRSTAVLAAALALGAAPAAARDAAPATPANSANPAAAGSWLRTRAALAERMPYVHNAKAADLWGDWADLVDAGDLDGDGRGDLVDVRSRLEEDEDLGFRETVRLDAYRGSDGTLLWSRTLRTSSFVFVYATKVGLDGRPGILVTSYDVAGADVDDEAGGAGGAMTLTSYDRTGTPVWARAFTGSFGYAPEVTGAAWTDVDGFLDANGSGGTDVLLRSTAEVESAAGRSAIQFGVLDGGTGAVTALGAPIVTAAPEADSVVTGDLNLDKLDDFAVEVVAGGVRTLVGMSGFTGARLWEIPNYSTGENRLFRLPDVTGDDRAEIGVRSYPSGPVAIAPAKSPVSTPRVVLVDGGRGTVLWRRDGTHLDALGNVDGRPGAEVVVAWPVRQRDDAGFTAAAYTASGRRLWSVTRKVRAAGFLAGSAFGTIGDVHGDGVQDLGFSLVGGGGPSARRDEGVVNGRTGRVTRDPRPGMYATRAAFDGRGADAYERATAGGVLTMHAWRGDRPARLWSVAVRLRGGWLSALPTSVETDTCGDLAVTVIAGEATFRSVVLSGATGRPLWTLDRSANAAAKVAKPSVAAHRTYTRGC